MNNKHQENGALTGPLIFTLPASNFVAILRLDWLGGNSSPFPPKTHGWEWDLVPTAPRRTGPNVLKSGLGDIILRTLPATARGPGKRPHEEGYAFLSNSNCRLALSVRR